MNVFVIIVTFKGKQWYNKCFESLRRSRIPLKVIVVDNSPGENDANYIKACFPEIYLIKTRENLGFGRANNLGIRYALDNGCDYVFLLNQDTWIEQDSVEKLIEIAKCHPDYGIISPIHLNAKKNALNMGLGLGPNNHNMQLLSDLYCNTVQDIYETNYVNAAAWLLPRKTLEVVGGFDPIFRHYEEDDNYLNRVIYHKFKIGVCPSARIVHDHRDSFLTDGKLLLRQQQALLVRWTNINQPFSVCKEVRYCMRKWLSYTFSGNFKQARTMCNQMKYCISMRDAINYSREESIQKKASWL